MLQDITPHTLFNQYDPTATPTPEDYALHFDGGKLLVKPGEPTQLLHVRDYPENTGFTYLFRIEDTRFFLASEEEIPADCVFVDIRTLRAENRFPKEIMFALFTGKHLSDWYRDTRFCGRCGGAMRHSPKERAMKCACGYTAHPRIMPAVIVGVKNGNSILLTKYRTGISYNALIAGFTEIGETAEQTVAREVMEEAGVRVKNITYYKTQPWGIANDLLIGYFCELDGDPAITMDPGELKYAAWVRREDIQLQPDDFSLTNEMMARFQSGEIR